MVLARIFLAFLISFFWDGPIENTMETGSFHVAEMQQDDHMEGVKCRLEKLDGDDFAIVITLNDSLAAKIRSQGQKFEGHRFLRMRVGGAPNYETPAMIGRIEYRDEKAKQLVFYPKYPLSSGKEYSIELRQKRKWKSVGIVNTPEKEVEASKIVGVYPSAERLPENLLKFYIVFSMPMTEGDVYEHFRLLDEHGEEVLVPFLKIEQELWSRDRKRLLLLLDPGRIKSGLRPREELGPILRAGGKYRLTISGKWKDANGVQLGKDFVKRFTATATDEIQPEPKSWKITAPQSGSRDGLRIELGESLDFAMLNRVINVKRVQGAKKNQEAEAVDDDSDAESGDEASGSWLPGEIQLLENETVVVFVPEQNWAPGRYVIDVSENLEDLAGNSIGKKFEVDRFDKTEPTVDPTTQIQFEIGNSKK